MIPRRTVLATPLLMSACLHTPATPQREGQHPFELATSPGPTEPVRMWLQLPPGYLGSTTAWPLVVFLHGSGERGTDLERVKAHGPPKLAERGANYPFILVSPQLEEGRRWDSVPLHALLLALQARLRIDPDRVCATGLSLGGHGVWDWATAYPQDLAAIAPVCGFGEAEDVCRLRQVPVRAYHGAADSVVPLARQQECVDALRACGGSAEFIVYPGVGHDAWNPAYDDPALVPWLMAQVRR
jgi:predicted peptidase